jgi:hypothetical protein
MSAATTAAMPMIRKHQEETEAKTRKGEVA